VLFLLLTSATAVRSAASACPSPAVIVATTVNEVRVSFFPVTVFISATVFFLSAFDI